MKKLTLMFLAGSVLMSCVNEEYDLNKVDGTAVIAKDIALPIGSLEKMMIEDIITLDSEGTMITKNENGDLTFQFKGNEPFSESITVPSFTIPFSNEVASNVHSMTINAGPYAGMSGTSLAEKVELKQKLEKALEIEDTHLLPSEVVDARYVELEMLVDYVFSVSSGAAHISEGFIIDFPDWMTLEKADDSALYTLGENNGNKNFIRFNSDVKINEDSPIVLDLMIKKVVFPEGSIVPGGNNSQGKACKKVWLDPDDEANKIKIDGTVYMLTADFPIIPPTLDVDMQLTFSNFEVTAANVSLDMDFNFDGHTLSLTDYPDFFTGDDVVLDIYDAFLAFNVTNTLPVSLEVNADFEAYKNSILTQSMHLGSGAENGTKPIVIPAQSTDAKIVFSKLEKDGSIWIPEISDLLLTLPDKVKVSDVSASCSQDFVYIVPGTKYDCALAYEFYAPLAFGKDFRFAYDLDIEDIGLDLGEYGVKSAIISLNAINSLPLNFDISAQALDAEGQPSDVTLEVKGSVASGTQNNPAVSPIEIHIKSADKAIQLNTLKLRLTAKGPSDAHLGTPLNEAQGLKIDDLALRLPDGVTVDMTAIFKMDPPQDTDM